MKRNEYFGEEDDMVKYLAAVLTLCLGGCVTIESPATMAFADGTNFVLLRPMQYKIGKTRSAIVVPAGFVTDYASIPLPFRGFLERQSRYSRAAIVHDFLYWSQKCSRDQSDNLFMIAMKESGVGMVRRGAIYGAVSTVGWVAWNGNQTMKADRLPRIVPPHKLGLANTLDWPVAQAQLKQEGVHDPDFTIPVGVCALGNQRAVP